MPDNPIKPSIAVIGAGITGISIALELARAHRFEVTLFDKSDRLGGLAASAHYDGQFFDRIYRIVLPSDSFTLGFLDELELRSSVFWKEMQSGFFADGRLVPFTSSRDYYRFPFLNLRDKFRLGLGMVYCLSVKDRRRLRGKTAETWLLQVFGKRIYDSIWSPLLYSKLGEAADRTPAEFMWATMRRLYGGRSLFVSPGNGIGYVRGGFHAVLEAAGSALKQRGVDVRLDSAVERIGPDQAEPSKVRLYAGGEEHKFDRAISTLPAPLTAELISESGQYRETLGRVEYLGIVGVLLVLKRKLSPYYVINLVDRTLPFTGIIETTNVIHPEEIGGLHLVYLPKYGTAADSVHNLPDRDVTDLFYRGLRKVFPELKPDDVAHTRVFREKYVQPLNTMEDMGLKPGFQTPTESLYLANTSMVTGTLHNMNAMIDLGKEAARVIAAGFDTRE